MNHLPLDFVRDEPETVDDVRDYALGRLQELSSTTRTAIARQVADAAKGNFLYARYVVDTLLSDPHSLANPEAIVLPRGLDGHYEEYLDRELTRRGERWEDRYRPLLGLLSVAVEPGLMRETLGGAAALAPSRVDDALKPLSQYLQAPDDGGPLQLFHESFREFLAKNSTFPVYPVEAHAALGLYFFRRHNGSWSVSGDDYAILNTLDHLARASAHEGALDSNTAAAISSAHDQLQSDREYADALVEETWIQHRATPHVVRAAELAIVDHWMAVGDTPILLIVGTAGSGKTTLAAKIVQLTRQSHRRAAYSGLSSNVLALLLRGSVVEQNGWTQIVNRLAAFALAYARSFANRSDELSGEVTSDLSQRWALTCALLRRIRAFEGDKRLLVLIDGLDEIRDPAGEVPPRLAELAESGAVRLIVTTRDSVSFHQPFPAHGTTLVRLAGLPVADTVAYLHSLGIPERDAERIAIRADGDLLFAGLLADEYRQGELLGADDIPDSILGLIAGRLARIERGGEDRPAARQLLVVLASRPEGLTAAELAVSCQVSVPQVERSLERLSFLLISDSAGRYRPMHPRIGEAIRYWAGLDRRG